MQGKLLFGMEEQMMNITFKNSA